MLEIYLKYAIHFFIAMLKDMFYKTSNPKTNLLYLYYYLTI